MFASTLANAGCNPRWHEAMNGPQKEEHLKAAQKEIDTLKESNCWEEVDRKSWMNVSPGAWAFKCKRFPDGSVQKLKQDFALEEIGKIQLTCSRRGRLWPVGHQCI